jgi:hypothetical protein
MADDGDGSVWRNRHESEEGAIVNTMYSAVHIEELLGYLEYSSQVCEIFITISRPEQQNLRWGAPIHQI